MRSATRPEPTEPPHFSSWIGEIDIPIAGFEPAIVIFPDTAEKKPLIVVAHGAGGQASWHCRHWHGFIGNDAILLCPRGKRQYARDPSKGYYFPDHPSLGREVLAALAALRLQAGSKIASGPITYAGYSQGATMGALAFASDDNPFQRLVLVEGGVSDWSLARAKKFRASGGRRILLVCGTNRCWAHARAARDLLHRAAVEVRAVAALGQGHRPDGGVGRALVESLPWLFQGDTRYSERGYVYPGPWETGP